MDTTNHRASVLHSISKDILVNSIDNTIACLTKVKELILSGNSQDGLRLLNPELTAALCREIPSQGAGDYPEYRQNDPRWGEIKLSSTETMRQVGCYITAMASALCQKGKKIGEESIDPGKLAQYLLSKKKITSDAMLMHDPFTSFDFSQEDERTFTIERVTEALSSGKIVIVQILNPYSHFMLMKGIDRDGNIMIMDPIGKFGPSIKASQVSSVRVFKPR